MKGDFTWGGEHTILCTDDVLQNCTLATYMILLANVTPKIQQKEKMFQIKDTG